MERSRELDDSSRRLKKRVIIVAVTLSGLCILLLLASLMFSGNFDKGKCIVSLFYYIGINQYHELCTCMGATVSQRFLIVSTSVTIYDV